MEICKEEKCTGCGACFNVCPVNAIRHKRDKWGFNRFDIDEDLCIQCGACKQVCLAEGTKENNSMFKVPSSYIVCVKNNSERLKSASGGMAAKLSEIVIKEGGYVTGVEWDDDFNAIMKLSNDINDIEKFRGSKYVESNAHRIYDEIKKKLIAGETVLFIGLPCQVSGLYNYLQIDYANLFTVDIICTGVPSRTLFEKYIRYTENELHSKLQKLSHRDKSKGYNQLGPMKPIKIHTFKGKTYFREAFKDSYYTFFLNKLSLHPVCERCLYAKIPRVADISIGDFEQAYISQAFKCDRKEFNRGDVSSVLVNTDKGNNLFEKCKHHLIYEECELREILLQCQRVYTTTKSNDANAEFLADSIELEYKELVKKYFRYNFLKRTIVYMLKKLGGLRLVAFIVDRRRKNMDKERIKEVDDAVMKIMKGCLCQNLQQNSSN